MGNNRQSKIESVLVVILAETRAHEYTFNLFRKNLLDIMNADLCLCVANNQREDINNPFYRHAKYVWRYDEPDDWGEAFDYIQKTKNLKNNWRKLIEVKDQWLGGVKGIGEQPGSAGILLFFRLFLKESIIKHKVINQYDRFVITRSDFMHRLPHVQLTLLKNENIWIPYGQDYGGYTDRHIVVHRNDVLNVLSIADRIITEPEKLHSEMAFCNRWNLEKFIKFSFAHLGLISKVRRFPYTMYTIRAQDGHTRWSKGEYCESLGYCIKYPGEYECYKLASLLFNKYGHWNKLNIFIFNALIFLRAIKKAARKKIKKIKKVIKRIKIGLEKN